MIREIRLNETLQGWINFAFKGLLILLFSFVSWQGAQILSELKCLRTDIFKMESRVNRLEILREYDSKLMGFLLNCENKTPVLPGGSK